MSKILVANDDGIKSWGLSTLYQAVCELGDAIVVTPQHQKSATAKALTINNIVRYISDTLVTGEAAFGIDGTPADSVPMSIYLLGAKPRLVVAGINLGENTSYHNILTSGTCAIGYEAALNQIPAICFSCDVPRKEVFNHAQKHDFSVIKILCTEIIQSVLQSPWPADLAFLNVNFPYHVALDTPIHFTTPTIRSFTNEVTEGKDPRGNPYFWIIGQAIETFPVGTDSWAVKQKKEISISPISLNTTCSMPPFEWRSTLNIQTP